MDELPAAAPIRKEACSYFRGLPDSPKLVARSTTTPWNDSGVYERLLDLVGKHVVVPLWNDFTGPLRCKILEAVEDIDWNAIDILRCGSTDFKDRHLVRPVILFVSVEPESTTWLNGRAVAFRCRQVLRENGIHNVEVDSEPSTAKLSPHIPALQEEGYRRDSIQLSEFLGTKIAFSRNPTREGTKGLYLRIRNTETVVALTCRHVIFGPEEENIDVCHDTHNSRGVIQPGNKTYQHTTNFLRDQICQTQSAIDLGESFTPVPEQRIEYLRGYKAKKESSLHRIEPFESIESRTVGHVLFSPKFGLSCSSPARFRDWALIELYQKKHQTPLQKLENKVPAELDAVLARPQFMSGRHSDQERERKYNMPPGVHTSTQTGVMSETEMRCPNFELTVPGKTIVDEGFMLVCMYGSASGATHGVTNTARSVVRRFVDGLPVVSEEWCILGSIEHGARKKFSVRGDSGASVMGDDGRVVAILICGAQGDNRGIHHISYVTPIESLLEDIRDHGYDVEWMGKQDTT
ncbi:hypothetical protein F25303_7187 [Fusarium sp. NRRL 25303]|nr:hypothetical protein F25303_7187 [Fusarium sp. NRRL 25303]